MTLKGFWKRSVVKLILIYLVLILSGWLLGPNSPIFPPSDEVGVTWSDNLSHGSGSYHDPYEYRLRI